MRGQIGVGICKLLFNGFTLGIWSLVDWIIAMVKAYSTYNDTEDITFINGVILDKSKSLSMYSIRTITD